MTDENTTPASRPRRASISQTLFGRPSISGSDQPLSASPNGNSGTASVSSSPGHKPGNAMASAMAHTAQQQRRLSITTLGLSGAAGPGPFSGGIRRDSSGSAPRASLSTREGRSSLDEEAVEDGPPLSSSNGQSSPFGRRMSFGARAYRDNVRAASAGSPPGAGNAATPSAASKGPSSPPSSGKGSGFNWSDTLRSRAERTSIVGNAAGMPNSGGFNRARSGTDPSQAPPSAAAPKPIPKAPDHFQERILKGDFYMD